MAGVDKEKKVEDGSAPPICNRCGESECECPSLPT